MNNALPAAFGQLSRYLAEWALTTEQERHRKRVSVSLEDVHAFNHAVAPRIHEIIAHLNKFPGADPDTLPPPERNLYNLALAFMESSHPVDLHWQRTDIDDAFAFERMEYLAPIDRR
ncbi:MAG: hypothetical protein ACXWJT_01265 [Xanthobacteraceae bacterium]